MFNSFFSIFNPKIMCFIAIILLQNCNNRKSYQEAKTSDNQHIGTHLKNAPTRTEERRESAQENEQREESRDRKAESADVVSKSPQDVGVVNANLNSQKDRKFVRTAETKCKVKNVQKATRNLEELAVKYKGFITNGNFQSQIVNQFNKPATNDSVLNVKIVQVIHDLTMRVPNVAFDSLLRDVQKMADFVDYRIVRANDVNLQIMAKALFIDRFKNYENNYNKMYGSNTVYGQDHLLGNQTNTDQQKIDKLRLEDEVNYSTIQINLYQKEYAYQEMAINLDKIVYQPSFITRLANALYEGWQTVENAFLSAMSIWFFWIILALGFFAWRKLSAND